MSLVITKQSGNFFSLVFDGGDPIISEQNRLTTIGNYCNFKTANGANIILKQNVLFSDITIIDGVSFVPASIIELWSKLIEVGFFDGVNISGGGGGGTDTFLELLDTFNSYSGRSGQIVVVNDSGTGLETISYSVFTAEDRMKLDGIQSGAQVNVTPDWSITNPALPGYIANKPDPSVLQFPKIQFVADGIQVNYDLGTELLATAAFEEGALLDDADWSQDGSVATLTYIVESGRRVKFI